MHKLLKRQLRKLGGEYDIPEKFLEAIDSAYHEFDSDLERSERILDQSLKELFETNKSLKVFAESKEQEASDLSNRLSDIFNTVSEVIFQVSPEGEWVFLNPAFEDITGFSAESAVGQKVKDYIHPDDQITFEVNCGQLNAGEKQRCQSTVRFKSKTSGYKWVEIRSRIKKENGINLHITGTITDVDNAYKMQEANNKLALVAQKTQNVIVISDTEGKITFVNQAFENLTEYSEEEVLGRAPGSFLQGPKTDRKVASEIGSKLRSKEPFNGEILNYTKSGQPYWLKLAIDPIYDESEVHIGFIAVESDISEEKEREVELTKLNTRLNLLLENLNSAVLVEDENRKVVLTNDQFLDFFEISSKPKDLLGTDCSHFAEKYSSLMANPQEYVSRIHKILDERQTVFEEIIHFANGSIMERSYFPIIIESVYYGHLWQYRDITERVNHQNQIEASELKYRTLLENLKLGLLEVDTSGVIINAFDGFRELTGYSNEELEGKVAADVFLDDDGKAIANKQLSLRKQGDTNVYEQKLLKKDGSAIWALISATPVYDTRNKVVGAIGVHMDLSQQKESEAKLKSYAQELESINKELDQFAYIVSHDLKAPLRAINNLSEWIEEDLEGKLDDDTQENFNLLRGRVSRMENLINGILEYSRAGRLTYEQEEVETLQLLREIEDGLFTDSKAKLVLEGEFPTLQTERIALSQIFSNLISNALKYNDKEEPLITVTCTLDDKYTFTVEDNGPGIKEEFHERIFQIFQTLQARDSYESTGVGLSIVKKILDEKGCNISVESEEGKGTKFIFEWPK